jgi:hypothetical protein
MTSTIYDREPLLGHHRSAAAPLGRLQGSTDTPAELAWRRARWSGYLRCVPHPQAPLATRLAALLYRQAVEGGRLPAPPGSLYPAGFRHQVVGHTGLPPDGIGVDPRRLGPLRSLLESGPADDDAQVALVTLLNVLTLYPLALRVADRIGHAGSPALRYEAARAGYGSENDDHHAVQPFELLARQEPTPLPVRLSALTQIVTHYCRHDQDLDDCTGWARLARVLAARTPAGDFGLRLALNRLHRGLALYAWRRRDTATTAEELEAALRAARELTADARDEAERVLAAQDERLVLEAALKAFTESRGRFEVFDARAAAERIGVLDPCDPYAQLAAGDAFWVLGASDDAVQRYAAAARMGTYPGSIAAFRAGSRCA